MLKALFGWLDTHPNLYWAALAVPTGALIVVVVSSFWQEGAERKRSNSDGWFLVFAIAVLIGWRWPALLESREFNPDESQLIAGALTLTHDPVFWRSVDGTTSGPLNFYALLPLHALGLPLDYFTARLAGFLLISVTLVACYRLLRSFAAAAPAELAMLPLIVFFATTTDPFFLEYSSGDVSVALFSVSALLMFRDRASGSLPIRGLLCGSFLSGMLPWAKLQSAPLTAALVGGALWLIANDGGFSRRQRLQRGGAVLLAAALPTLIGLALVGATGQFAPFVQGYLRQNFVYVGTSESIASAFFGMWKFTAITQVFPAFLFATLAMLAVSLGFYLVCRARLGRLFFPALAWVVAAVVCVLTPHRPYAHYLLLTVVPLTLWSGVAIGDAWSVIRCRRVLGLLLLVVGGLAPLAVRLRHPVPGQFGNFAENWRRPYSLAGTLLRSCRLPGDSVGVWGWRTDLYVDGQMPQATRDPHTVWSIVDTAYRPYYRDRFVADLRRSRPAFFVDAVGPGAVFYQDRDGLGHGTVPALADYVAREYVLLADLQSERIYARADLRRDSRRQFNTVALQRILAKARRDAPVDIDAPQPNSVEPSSLGTWDIDGHSARMLLPPAKLTWMLDGTEIEASFSFGFHPRAYLEGTSNGADFIVELEAPGIPPRTLFKRHLDPARSREDRKLLSARVSLPRDVRGSRLVIRTEPGEYGDQAWDWVYLAGLRYVRAPAQSFPGFAAEVVAR